MSYFIVASVKCGLYEISKNNRANATHGPSPVQQMFRGRTKVTLDQRCLGPGLGPVQTVAAAAAVAVYNCFLLTFS